jgi:1,2-diacylglycerol 3-alpha-glucosyltransferase
MPISNIPKILVIASEYPPYGSGIANVVENVVNTLGDMGIECTVCTPHGPDIKLGSWQLIQKTGVLGLLYFWYEVSRYFKYHEYGIVWMHNPFFIFSNPLQKCVVTMHSTYYGESTQIEGVPLLLRIYRTLVKILERYCLTRMNRAFFTGVNASVCKEIEEIGINPERIAFISNGVEIQRFCPRKERQMLRKKFEIHLDAKVLLSVGRLTYHKQPFLLLKLFSLISQKIENLILVFVGTGELFDTLITYAEKNNICNVKFLGHINHKTDLPGLYACSDFFITSSSYEGIPLTLLEAMASGLPCIVSNIPNFHVVKDAECGIVINFQDLGSVEQLLHYITTHQGVHSRNARGYAQRNFDWRIISNKYLELFQTHQNI